MICEAKKYMLIYADPPWQYKVWSQKGAGRCAEHHYNTLSFKDLSAFNIPGITEAHCALLMWATFPCLKQAIALGEAWGFTYKTVAFTWIKSNKNGRGLFFGMGYYTRANAEVVLLFTKRKPLPRIARNVPQVLLAPVGRHSEKPDEIRKRIVRLFGDVSRIELFARNPEKDPESIFDGWDVFGNEVSNSVSLSL